MANQGLFTSSSFVDDLLQKRNQRATDLQQQLMAGAAQGARDPAKAQAVSLLGSSLGRALAGSMGGGDKQLESARAQEEAKSALQEQYGQSSRMTPQQQLAFSNQLMQNGFTAEGQQMHQQAQASLQQQRAALDARLDAEALQSRSHKLGESLTETHPNIAKLLMSGDATESAYKAGLKALDNQGKGKDGSGSGGSVSAENMAALDLKRTELEKMVEDGDLTQQQFNIRMNQASQVYKGGSNPYLTAKAQQDSKGLQKALDDSNDSVKGINQTIAKYRQSIAILDTGVHMGTGADALQLWRGLAVAMGVASDETEVNEANFANYKSLAIDAALAYVAKTSGAISEKEMDLFAKAAQGTDKSLRANKVIVETALKVAQWTRDKDNAINEWANINRDAFVNSSDLRKFEKQWVKANTLDLSSALAVLSTPKAKITELPAGSINWLEKAREDLAIKTAKEKQRG